MTLITCECYTVFGIRILVMFYFRPYFFYAEKNTFSGLTRSIFAIPCNGIYILCIFNAGLITLLQISICKECMPIQSDLVLCC
jgi:hypothetical protein